MLTAEQSHEFWEKRAQDNMSYMASWEDYDAIAIEQDAVLKALSRYHLMHAHIADVGCANGFSTLRYADERQTDWFYGIDFSHAMIQDAKLTGLAIKNVHFAEHDIMQGPYGRPSVKQFDSVLSTRMLINLGCWERQQLGIKHLKSMVKPNVGCMLILQEATVDGWHNLNDFRAEFHLGPLPMPPMNQYLCKGEVIDEVIKDHDFRLVSCTDLHSTYYVITRVLKPVMHKLQMITDEAAAFGSLISEFAGKIPSYGEFSPQRMFVFEHTGRAPHA